MKSFLSRFGAAAGLVVVGAAFGYGAETPSSAPMIPENVASCEGGMQNNLQMTLTPLWVKGGKGGERLGLSLDAHSLFKTKAQAKLAVEMVDDRGHPVIDAVVSPRLRMLPGAEGVQTLELTTPEKLADGYYTVRATGAAIAADESTENVVQMYLRRENGEFFSISYEEYIAKSRALLEVAAQ
ncbi:MAG: hypothetical protein H6730_24350 [Deltaproteobacteria bacterium]|nr:hypothetical protein [Deltaproteobacteria bacterium]